MEVKNKMDKFSVFCIAVICLLVLTLLGVLSGLTYDELYCKPIASDRANDFCIRIGFDQYKQFSRVGLFSINPIAIKCEYVERYTDLGVRSNI